MDLFFWRIFALSAAALGQTVFVLLYMTFPWWRSFLGRALFFGALALALLADTVVAARLFEWEQEDATLIALYGVFAIGIWWQVFAFLRVRFGARKVRWEESPSE